MSRWPCWRSTAGSPRAGNRRGRCRPAPGWSPRPAARCSPAWRSARWGRPRRARWLRLGAGCLIVAELPLVILQQATQSTFPVGTLLYRWPAEVAATAPGAPAVLGPDGQRWQRAMGSFPHPNVLGGFVAAFLVLGLPWLAQGGRTGTAREQGT